MSAQDITYLITKAITFSDEQTYCSPNEMSPTQLTFFSNMYAAEMLYTEKNLLYSSVNMAAFQHVHGSSQNSSKFSIAHMAVTLLELEGQHIMLA